MDHGGLLAGLVLVVLLPQVCSFKINVEEMEDSVSLLCNTTISWIEGTEGTLMEDNKRLNLGKRILDPRGQYLCGKHGSDNDGYVLQVYYRMCQNCVELDSATLAGIIITDIIATLLLALGVYCFSGHETGRISGTTDTQTLLSNDQLYQPLRDRDDAQYSRIGGNWPRNK
ncbi:T-cell surface glycoprotein CD3 delta chain isoform X1 [Ochotona curzoniae]|uniref:T-cell surface glycoprotein CD3 delta chain isoform X1 n=1 Tax=Ochotona curzoniae TaxID=130825 RepID=UPI001B34CE86|nr:T-cell surface glycoprotein CD3 delta chain isoform X1 [Ochotona curzoniae]